ALLYAAMFPLAPLAVILFVVAFWRTAKSMTKNDWENPKGLLTIIGWSGLGLAAGLEVGLAFYSARYSLIIAPALGLLVGLFVGLKRCRAPVAKSSAGHS